MTYAMHQGQFDVAIGARPRAGVLRVLEALALAYLLMISSGMFGFVDVLTFGDLYDKEAESPFAGFLWPIAYLMFAGLTVVAWRELTFVVRNNLWVLAFPVVVALSALWSKDAAATIDGTIRMGMTTLMGIYLGSRFDIQDLAKAVFLIMLVAVGASVLSALAGVGFALMEDGTVRGVFHHKNTLGSRAALLFSTSLALLIAGWRPHLAIAGLGCALFAAVVSQSATSVALAGLCLIVLPVAVVLRARWSTLVYALILLGALVSLIAFLIVFYRINPVVEILTALGRDLTFTGRILLWDAAFDYLSARPLLGTGFDAFWTGRLDWRILIVMEELGNILHFHNSFLEIAVTLGAAGLLAVLVTLGGYGRAALMALRLRVDPLSVWPTIFAAVLFAVAMVEVEIFVQHKILHILLIALGIAAARQVQQERAVAAPTPGGPAPLHHYHHVPRLPSMEAAHGHHQA
ncbi:MAG: O-antigen ligase [Geminicoccaceae bacterium]|nr:O-antigen ligase [Geminicoccaceae bacterium]